MSNGGRTGRTTADEVETSLKVDLDNLTEFDLFTLPLLTSSNNLLVGIPKVLVVKELVRTIFPGIFERFKNLFFLLH